MIQPIEITINGEKYTYSEDVTLQEIYMEHQDKLKYPIILAKVNNHLKELSSRVKENAKVEFLDLTSPEGNRAHISGLLYRRFFHIIF